MNKGNHTQRRINMFDDNQITNDNDLFDEVAWDEDTTEASEPEVKEEVAETVEEKPFDWGSLELKGVQGVKKLAEYTPEEVKALLQKGGDYDRIREGYEQFKQVKEIAKLYDMNPNDLIGNLKENHFKNRAELNGTTEEFERKQYDLALKELEITQKETEVQEQSKREKMFEQFVKENPNADPYNLPPEVVKAVQDGEDLNGAYARYQNKQLAQQIAQMQKQIENMQRAPVTSTTANGTDTLQSEDDFLQGFWGKG